MIRKLCWLFCLCCCLVLIATAALAQNHPIVGTWMMRSQNLQVITRFNPDGSCQRQIMQMGQAPINQTGTYQINGALLFIQTDGENLRLNVAMPNENTLRMTDDQGNGLEMVRLDANGQPMPTQTQPGMPGGMPQQQPGGFPQAQQPQQGYNQYPAQQQPGYNQTQPGQQPAPGPGSSLPDQKTAQGPAPGERVMVFVPYIERNEQAFRVLIPKGWQAEGGILRVNPIQAGGPGNSNAAKTDFAVKKDPQGTVMVRWLPTVYYADRRHMATSQAGLFPYGSNYKGMQVTPLHGAADFLVRMAFPYAHPQASGLQVVEAKPMPQMAQKLNQRTLANGLRLSYDAAMVRVVYQEGGVTYEERLITCIEDMGQLGAGMWSNKDTMLIRAPQGQLPRWEGVIKEIQDSIRLNPVWVAGELAGQIKRGEMAWKSQQELNRMASEIVENRRHTNAEIRNNMYLFMTGQEEYVNPHTNQVDVGSNQWKRRWVNGSGEVVYTDDPNYDPNWDQTLRRSDYKLTPVRPR